jgi:hypothetical protein
MNAAAIDQVLAQKPEAAIQEIEGMMVLPDGQVVLGTAAQLTQLSGKFVTPVEIPDLPCEPD